MRPVVTAILLVVLMSMSVSAWNPEEKCQTDDPYPNCRHYMGGGFYQYGMNRCVKAFPDEQLSNADAEAVCQKYKNGKLVSIHSAEEAEKVECAMFNATPEIHHYWIGLKRENDIFLWTDDSTHDFSRWGHRQPDNYKLKENCVEMSSTGVWNDQSCCSTRPFVCQVTLT